MLMASKYSEQFSKYRFTGRKTILSSGLLILVFLCASFFLTSNSVTSTEAITEENIQVWTPCGDGVGMPNPAAIYCIEMGYKLEVITEEGGGQHSVCIFDDANKCDAWSFMIGKCGNEYSYCAVNGYEQIVKTDGKNPFSPIYPVCIEPSSKSMAIFESGEFIDYEVGNPLDLMGITDRLMEQQIEFELPPVKLLPRSLSISPLAELPDSFDWRDHNGGNWTTPPKDQNACGSCWAHSAVSATEAAYNLFLNNPDYDLNLAEEYPNSDCLVNNSCCGGWHYNAFELIKTNGVPDEACLPYDSGYYSTGDCNCFGQAGGCPDVCLQNDTGVCNEKDCDERCADVDDRLVTIFDYIQVDEDTDSVKQALIDHGPLSVCFGTSGGTSWDDGDVRRCNSDNPGYVHCVTIVGYDDSFDGFWILKDNYGTTSFDGTGHWRMGYDECNIQKLAYYAIPDENSNLPPRAEANGPYVVECELGITDVQLDGSGSYPDNDSTNYSWSSSCPGASFDDPASTTPVLSIDTSGFIGCGITCNATLSVENDSWPHANTSTTTVTVQDTTAPELKGVPANTTVECDAVPEPAEVTAIDNCDYNPSVYFSETRTDRTCSSNYQLTRTWTAMDACGNSSSQTQIINVVDTTAPELIDVPEDITVECDAVPEPASVYAIDNCDTSPTVNFSETRIDGNCSSDYVLFRTWQAVDDCGNSTSQTQTITVEDTTPPIISCNAPATIVPPDAPISFTATAVDNCDDSPLVKITGYDCYFETRQGRLIDKKESCVVEISGDQITILDSGGVGTTITWTIEATDSCNNSSDKLCDTSVIRLGN